MLTIRNSSLLAISSVSVSNLMLSIRSLAASLSLDSSDLLLSTAELSRVHWRPGRRAGEIIVEMDAVEEDHEMLTVASHHAGLRVTQVGLYEDSLMPAASAPRKYSSGRSG